MGNDIDVTADAAVQDGRVTVEASNRPASLYVSTPDRKLLGENEEHLELKVAGDAFETVVRLDAVAMDTLSDAIYHAQEDE